MKHLSLPTLVVASAIAFTAGSGCNKDQQQANNDQALKQDASTIKKSAKDAKDQIEQEAKAEKERVDAQAKAAQAKIDAQKAELKADSSKAKTEVDTQVQKIQQAGAAGASVQSQSGAGQSSSSDSSASSSSSDSDQKLTEKVQTSLKADSSSETPENLQVTVASGVVTLKGNVKSEEQKTQLEQNAKSISGVTKVDNQLSVKQ